MGKKVYKVLVTMARVRYVCKPIGKHIILLLFFRDPVNFHSPLFLDGWQSGWEFVAMLCESPFALDNTWKLIWDQKVSFVVTILTSVDKVSNKLQF